MEQKIDATVWRWFNNPVFFLSATTIAACLIMFVAWGMVAILHDAPDYAQWTADSWVLWLFLTFVPAIISNTVKAFRSSISYEGDFRVVRSPYKGTWDGKVSPVTTTIGGFVFATFMLVRFFLVIVHI